MHTHLLLDIIQKGVEELKQITDSFKKDTPESTEIDIATSKTEILLKEFYLLKAKVTDSDILSPTNINKDTVDDISNEKVGKKITKKTEDYPEDENHKPSTHKINHINKEKTFNPAHKEDKIIGETITSSTDLSNLININDKFQFSIELFNNNMELYNETINKLNSVSTFENAKKIISSFNWNEEDETVIHFYEILTRKFNYNV